MQKHTEMVALHECMGKFMIEIVSVYLASCMIEGGVGGTFLHVAFYDGPSVQRHIALPTL